ncbi:MAG: hypothetical protein JO020_06020, partial [Chloroflexi bacterium]|nr:hypothetical protein [Chloroflexota bacterium]
MVAAGVGARGVALRHNAAVVGETVQVNGREYNVPSRPTVVFVIDGGDPRYLDDALQRGLMPS